VDRQKGFIAHAVIYLLPIIGLIAGAIIVQQKTNFSPRALDTSNQVYWGSWINGSTYGSNGDAPWDLKTWDLFESHAGKKVSILHWGQCWNCGDFNYQKNQYDVVRSRGAIPLVDWGPSGYKLSDIANGFEDDYITTWAKQAKAWRHPFFLRFGHEMNGNWFDWGTAAGNPKGNNPQDYVNAYRHIHDIFVAQGVTNVTWVWCVNTEYSGSTNIDLLYPGDSYVDWTSIDGYNWGAVRGSWQTFDQVFSPTYNHILKIAPNKPVMLAETSSSETGAPSGYSKSLWITETLSKKLPDNYSKVKALVWFNWNTDGADWVIESSSNTQSAFANAISNSYYATNTFGNLPDYTKIRPLGENTTILNLTPTPTNTPTPTKPPITPTATPKPTASPTQSLPTPTIKTIPTATPVPPTPTATLTPTVFRNTNQGLTGAYFKNKNLTSLGLTKVDPTINFIWVTGSPNSTIPVNNFSVRWTGFITPPASGTYTFITRTDDGVRLWIDNKLLINRWRDQRASDATGTINLVKGQRYSLKMEYYESWGEASAQLMWQGPSISKQIVSQRYLTPQ
jgi:hypothetical protein